MARSIVSHGTELLRAFSTAADSVMLPSMLGPPSRAATSTARSSLANIWLRLASWAPFLRLIVFHLECPDIPSPRIVRARGATPGAGPEHGHALRGAASDRFDQLVPASELGDRGRLAAGDGQHVDAGELFGRPDLHGRRVARREHRGVLLEVTL